MFGQKVQKEFVRIMPDKLTHFRYRNLASRKVLVIQIECNDCSSVSLGREIILPATGIHNVDSHCAKCGKPLSAEVEFN